MYGSIRIRGARENNLKNVSLDIPNKDGDGGAAELPVVARCQSSLASACRSLEGGPQVAGLQVTHLIARESEATSPGADVATGAQRPSGTLRIATRSPCEVRESPRQANAYSAALHTRYAAALRRAARAPRRRKVGTVSN